MTTTTTRLAAAAAAFAILATTTACRDELDPPPQASPTNVQQPPSPSPSTTPAATGTTSTPTSPMSTPPSTTITPTPAEAKAYAAAEAVYRRWVVNFGVAAAAGFDAKKLDDRLATPALIKVLTKQFKTFPQKRGGGAGKYTQDIRWMKPVRYLKDQTVTFQLCAVTDLRFLLNGKDVTITPAGTPAPVETLPQLRYVSIETVDGGKTWRSSTILYSSDNKKASC